MRRTHAYGSLATLAAVASLMAGCGDPVLVLGDPPGTMRLVAGVPETAGITVGPDALSSRLNEPRSLALDGTGSVFVASTGGRVVQRFVPGGVLEIVADTLTCAASLCLQRPFGLAPDGLGGLYIGDANRDAIFHVDLATGEVTLVAGDGTPGVSDDGATAAGSPVSSPAGLAIDPSGRLYFAEGAAARIRRIESDGTLTTVAGSGLRGSSGDGGPATEASIDSPSGLAIGGGVLYFSDATQHRVRRVDLDAGIIDLVAGTGVGGFSGDGGPAVAATLSAPSGLALGPEGNALFVADPGNNRVRRIQLATGVIDTFAGNGQLAFAEELLPAAETPLAAPSGVAVSELGRLYIAATGHHVVWRTTIER
jgi:sugar lactone lactonase YvrE